MFFRRIVEDETAPSGSCTRLRIAIVGCGLAGVAAAIALMRGVRQPFEACLIDAAHCPGGFGDGPAGQALTDLPAGRLSVFADRPDDFSAWLKDTMTAGEGPVAAIPGHGSLHVPKSMFRDYVMARFGEALAARRDVTLRIVRQTVRGVLPMGDGGLSLALADGGRMTFDSVFLATGQGVERGGNDGFRTVADLLCGRSPRKAGEPMIIVGDGPRMAAALLHLRDCGFGGPVAILSPRGLLPLPHARVPGVVFSVAVPQAQGISRMLRALRGDARAAMRAGVSWQAVADGVEAALGAAWRGLPPEERRRYRRHLEPFHRMLCDRIAPELHRRLMLELDNPATTLMRAKLLRAVPGGAAVRRPGETHGGVLYGTLVDCREEATASAEGLLSPFGGEALLLEDDGTLSMSGWPVPGLYVAGRAAGALRPDMRAVPDMVRQLHRAAMRIDAGDVARLRRS